MDIDDTLIRGAWRRRRNVWSMQAPENFIQSLDSAERPKKRLHEVRGGIKSSYFPASLEHAFGPLSIPPSQHRGRHTFPHNITFRTADWVNSDIPEDKEGYDVVTACAIASYSGLV